ncbi:hypothetical protein J3U66_04700 [Gilliamella sp. B2969]|uniref:hypothetical protein n=1 Tax=Gilliamella sp. B2969 TaxID=2818021 RepID=UPI00226A9A72|nr:hypothetical protein [Gilliamella sp. B2969]MCX8729671.1 hypothetical protein [Gilliamella sp. B2969]
MEFSTLFNDNWLNLIVIFALSIIAFVFKKKPKSNYFENIIKYTDILEKTPQPQYQKDYLNNIKKKLLWEKVCFYRSGNRNKERIAISLINSDIYNIIDLTQLNSLTQYFAIEKNKIYPLKLFLVKEFVVSCIAAVIAIIFVLSNLNTIFKSPEIISVIIAILTIFIITIIISQFIVPVIKRLNMLRLILKDNDFLNRANHQLAVIIEDDQKINISIAEQVFVQNEQESDNNN